MKKISFLAIILVAFVITSAASADTSAKKVFAGSGPFQVYVDFSFTVPFGNCSNLTVYKFEQGYNYPTKTWGHWVQMQPNQSASPGWYRFLNNDAGCSPIFTISGNVSQVQDITTWGALEIEPEDVGIFVNGLWDANNYFQLSTDDYKYSYHLLMPNNEMRTSLSTFSSSYFVTMNGIFVGAIIADSRGFLVTKVNLDYDYIVRDDDVVILIYRENLQGGCGSVSTANSESRPYREKYLIREIRSR